MRNEERKKAIYEMLLESEEPITGSELARRFSVTRQIIVKDIGLLKAEGNQILSTARGYLLQKEKACRVKRTVFVCHDAERIEEELQIIVDLGGSVLTTSVKHPFYGNLGESLNIKSRKDISRFMKRIQETGCEPLLSLTKGRHIHIIEADDEETLDEICAQLNRAGYLIFE